MAAATSSAQQRTAEKKYEDISPLTSDAESDFENDPVAKHARNSTKIADHDRKLLDEEEEREKLLTAGNTRNIPRSFFNRRRNDVQLNHGGKTGKRTVHKSRRRRRKTKGSSHDEEGELMYEMEEGGPKSETSSQASSSSAELDKMNLAHSSMSKVRSARSSDSGSS